MNEKACINCRFYNPPGPGEQMGACRYDPPKIFPVFAPQQPQGKVMIAGKQVQVGGGPQAPAGFMAAWPPVPPVAWCGRGVALDGTAFADIVDSMPRPGVGS